MLNKLMPNILLVAGAVTFLTYVFGKELIEKLVAPVSGEILALLVGIGIGGLMTLAGQLATPPPGDSELYKYLRDKE